MIEKSKKTSAASEKKAEPAKPSAATTLKAGLAGAKESNAPKAAAPAAESAPSASTPPTSRAPVGKAVPPTVRPGDDLKSSSELDEKRNRHHLPQVGVVDQLRQAFGDGDAGEHSPSRAWSSKIGDILTGNSGRLRDLAGLAKPVETDTAQDPNRTVAQEVEAGKAERPANLWEKLWGTPAPTSKEHTDLAHPADASIQRLGAKDPQELVGDFRSPSDTQVQHNWGEESQPKAVDEQRAESARKATQGLRSLVEEGDESFSKPASDKGQTLPKSPGTAANQEPESNQVGAMPQTEAGIRPVPGNQASRQPGMTGSQPQREAGTRPAATPKPQRSDSPTQADAGSRPTISTEPSNQGVPTPSVPVSAQRVDADSAPKAGPLGAEPTTPGDQQATRQPGAKPATTFKPVNQEVTLRLGPVGARSQSDADSKPTDSPVPAKQEGSVGAQSHTVSGAKPPSAPEPAKRDTLGTIHQEVTSPSGSVGAQSQTAPGAKPPTASEPAKRATPGADTVNQEVPSQSGSVGVQSQTAPEAKSTAAEPTKRDTLGTVKQEVTSQSGAVGAQPQTSSGTKPAVAPEAAKRDTPSAATGNQEVASKSGWVGAQPQTVTGAKPTAAPEPAKRDAPGAPPVNQEEIPNDQGGVKAPGTTKGGPATPRQQPDALAMPASPPAPAKGEVTPTSGPADSQPQTDAAGEPPATRAKAGEALTQPPTVSSSQAPKSEVSLGSASAKANEQGGLGAQSESRTGEAKVVTDKKGESSPIQDKESEKRAAEQAARLAAPQLLAQPQVASAKPAVEQANAIGAALGSQPAAAKVGEAVAKSAKEVGKHAKSTEKASERKQREDAIDLATRNLKGSEKAQVENALRNSRIDSDLLKDITKDGFAINLVSDKDQALKDDQGVSREGYFNYTDNKIRLSESAFRNPKELQKVLDDELGHRIDDRLRENPETSAKWSGLMKDYSAKEHKDSKLNENAASSQGEFGSEVISSYLRGGKDEQRLKDTYPDLYDVVKQTVGQADTQDLESKNGGMFGRFMAAAAAQQNQLSGKYFTSNIIPGQNEDPKVAAVDGSKNTISSGPSANPTQPRPEKVNPQEDTRSTTTAEPAAFLRDRENKQGLADPNSPQTPRDQGSRPHTALASSETQPAKSDASAASTTQTGAATASLPRVETPSNGPQAVTSKLEAPKPEAPKPEASKPEAPKPEAPKPEVAKPEAPARITQQPQPSGDPSARSSNQHSTVQDPSPAPPRAPQETFNSNASSTGTQSRENQNYSSQNYPSQSGSYSSSSNYYSNSSSSFFNNSTLSSMMDTSLFTQFEQSGLSNLLQDNAFQSLGMAQQDLLSLEQTLSQAGGVQELQKLSQGLQGLDGLPQQLKGLDGLKDLAPMLQNIPETLDGLGKVQTLVDRAQNLPGNPKDFAKNPDVRSLLAELPSATKQVAGLASLAQGGSQLSGQLSALSQVRQVGENVQQLGKHTQDLRDLPNKLDQVSQALPVVRTAQQEGSLPTRLDSNFGQLRGNEQGRHDERPQSAINPWGRSAVQGENLSGLRTPSGSAVAPHSGSSVLGGRGAQAVGGSGEGPGARNPHQDAPLARAPMAEAVVRGPLGRIDHPVVPGPATHIDAPVARGPVGRNEAPVVRGPFDPKDVPAARGPAGRNEAPAVRGPVDPKDVPAARVPASPTEAPAARGPVGRSEAAVVRGPVQPKDVAPARGPSSPTEAPAARGPVGRNEAPILPGQVEPKDVPASRGPVDPKQVPLARGPVAPMGGASPRQQSDVQPSVAREVQVTRLQQSEAPQKMPATPGLGKLSEVMTRRFQASPLMARQLEKLPQAQKDLNKVVHGLEKTSQQGAGLQALQRTAENPLALHKGLEKLEQLVQTPQDKANVQNLRKTLEPVLTDDKLQQGLKKADAALKPLSEAGGRQQIMSLRKVQLDTSASREMAQQLREPALKAPLRRVSEGVSQARENQRATEAQTNLLPHLSNEMTQDLGESLAKIISEAQAANRPRSLFGIQLGGGARPTAASPVGGGNASAPARPAAAGRPTQSVAPAAAPQPAAPATSAATQPSQAPVKSSPLPKAPGGQPREIMSKARIDAYRQTYETVKDQMIGKSGKDHAWALVYHSRDEEGAKGLTDTLESNVVKGGSGKMQSWLNDMTKTPDSTVALSAILANVANVAPDRMMGIMLLTTDGAGGKDSVGDAFHKMSQNVDSSLRLSHFLEKSSQHPAAARGLAELLEGMTEPQGESWKSANRTSETFRGLSETVGGARRLTQTLENLGEVEGGNRLVARTLNRMSREPEGAANTLETLQNLAHDKDGAGQLGRVLSRASESRDGARDVLGSFQSMAKTTQGKQDVARLLVRLADGGQGARLLANFVKDGNNSGQLAGVIDQLNQNPESKLILAHALDQMAKNPRQRSNYEIFAGRVAASEALQAVLAETHGGNDKAPEGVEAGERYPELTRLRPIPNRALENPNESVEPSLQKAADLHRVSDTWRTERPSAAESQAPAAASALAQAEKPAESPTELRNFRPGDVYSEETLRHARICGDCGGRTTSLGLCPRCSTRKQRSQSQAV